MPVEGVLDLELGLEVRSVSDMMAAGSLGERGGRTSEAVDICEPERDEGKDDSDGVRPCAAPPEAWRACGKAVWADAIVDSPIEPLQGRRGRRYLARRHSDRPGGQIWRFRRGIGVRRRQGEAGGHEGRAFGGLRASRISA